MVLKEVGALGILGAAATGNVNAQQESWSVSSPNRDVTVTISLSDGTLSYSVSRNGSTIVDTSKLGITTATTDFIGGLSFEEKRTQSISDSYQTVTGKRLEHSYEAEELSLTFSKNGAEVILDVRAFNDGIGYRYRIPGSDSVMVNGESTEFNLPSDANAWLQTKNANYEMSWDKTTVADAGGAYTWGSLFELDSSWVLLGEADVDRQYCTTHPTINESESKFSVAFPEDSISASEPLATPWRVVLTGDLGTIVESDLIADLDDPAKFNDTSWIKPGRVSWSWWSDSNSPSSFEIQKEFVDYAAEHGWEYTLVDAGWETEWVPDLIDYANQQGVDIILWASWDNHPDFDGPSGEGLDTEAKRQEKLSRWSDWGAAGIKVDYMDSDTQEMMKFYHNLLEAAAEYELTVNYHGATLPKGWRRQWPHFMTAEGIKGAEYYKWSSLDVSHNVAALFTRNVLGPMDYTPVTFSASGRETTDAHELALSIVYESGQQHFADDVEVYAQYPLAERVLDNVAAAWDETVFVGGRPDSAATVARRSGQEWFVGTIAIDAQTIEVPLSFLDNGTEYIAEVTKDGDDGLTRDDSVVTSNDTISVDVPQHGGLTIYLPRAADRAPPVDISTAFEDDEDEIPPGESTQVTATLTHNGLSDIASGEFSITVPDGWTSQAETSTTFETVTPDASVEATWTIMVPDDAELGGEYDITIEASYTDENNNSTTHSASSSIEVPLESLPSEYSTFASREANFGMDGDTFVLQASGEEMWSGAPADEYGTIYFDDSFESGDTVTVKLLGRGLYETEFQKAGLMVRNEITGNAESGGYVVVAQEHNSSLGGDRGAFTVQTDGDGDGILDQAAHSAPDNTYPAWLRIERDGTTFIGSVKTAADDQWSEIASVEVPSATEAQDVGMFATSNNVNRLSEARFTDFEAPTPEGPSSVVGGKTPTDLDSDALYEDINGDGEATTTDVQALFENLDSDTVQNNPDAFDFNGDEDVTVSDVVALFREIV